MSDHIHYDEIKSYHEQDRISKNVRIRIPQNSAVGRFLCLLPGKIFHVNKGWQPIKLEVLTILNQIYSKVASFVHKEQPVTSGMDLQKWAIVSSCSLRHSVSDILLLNPWYMVL